MRPRASQALESGLQRVILYLLFISFSSSSNLTRRRFLLRPCNPRTKKGPNLAPPVYAERHRGLQREAASSPSVPKWLVVTSRCGIGSGGGTNAACIDVICLFLNVLARIPLPRKGLEYEMEKRRDGKGQKKKSTPV